MTDYWVLAGVLLLMLGSAARSYAISTLGLLLLVALLIAWLWARYALRRVTYTRTLSAGRVYAGESVLMEISVTNAKPVALPWLLIEDRLDSYLEARNVDAENTGKEWEIRHSLSVGWYERVRWKYSLECPRRGYHRVGPALLRSGDPFGFYEQEEPVPGHIGVLVYPRLLPVEELDLSSWFPFEGHRSTPGAVPDLLNVVGARPYAEHDTLREVHWRASARSTQLHSKVLRPTTEPSVLIFLDLASSRHAWEGIDVEAVERAISTAATLAHRVHAAHWALGLHVNGLRSGTRQRVRIGTARGDGALAGIMDVLARVPPYPTVPFADLLRAERRHVPPGATVVAVTAVSSLPVADQVELYRRSGHNTLLLDVAALPGAPRR